MTARALLVVNVAVKAMLVAWLAYAVARPELPQFDGKAMQARIWLYPLSLFLVPVIWRGWGRSVPYPHLIDATVVLTFVLDTVGNAHGWYLRWQHYDDLLHWLNPVLLVMIVAFVSVCMGIGHWVAGLLAIGLGSTAHILWELIEYALFNHGADLLGLTLADTLSDLSWGIVGSILGAAIGVRAAGRTVRCQNC